MKPKLYVCEEHNEAFAIIEKARINGELNKNNILLHYDAHEDMYLFNVPKSLYEIFKGTNKEMQKKINEYAKETLSICSFIMPSVLLGTIKSVYWIIPSWSLKSNNINENIKLINKKKCVGSLKGEGKTYFAGELDLLKIIKFYCPDLKIYDHNKILSKKIPKNCDAIIDIDLDYFTCYSKYDISEKIEITKKQYFNFKKQKYNRIRNLGFWINLLKIKEKYYLILDYKSNYENRKLFGFKDISNEIEIIFKTIKKNNVNPSLIILTKSSLSGFTNPRIIKEVIKKIKKSIKKHIT